jgi:oligopeptide/dipeptide ABC transporter ATP-binding protein
MSSLLNIRDLSVHFPVPRSVADFLVAAPRQLVRAVNGVTLELAQGQTLGLVGESGCGKSTLGRAVLRLTQATAGDVVFDGRSVLGLQGDSLLAFRRRAQMVFQDPHASMNPKLTVGQTIGEVLRVHRLCPKEEIDRRVGELMERVGLTADLIERKPAGLSGGQCQRVGIARALAVGPDLIIADESVSALDVSIQAQILNLFLELQRDLNLTMVFISHDLSVVRHMCQMVAVMYLGRIVEYGPSEEVFRHPQHPYTQALIEAIPVMAPDARLSDHLPKGEPPSPLQMPLGCPFHPRCPHAMPVCQADPAPPGFRVDTQTVRCHLYAPDIRSSVPAD